LREVIVLLRRQPLVAQEYNLVIEESLVKLLELRILQRNGQVEAANLGAERSAEESGWRAVEGRAGWELMSAGRQSHKR